MEMGSEILVHSPGIVSELDELVSIKRTCGDMVVSRTPNFSVIIVQNMQTRHMQGQPDLSVT
jgi:hypothetical protein